MEKIKEVIVVEGRDDVSAVLRAVDAQTICTHGYGISKKTIEEIRSAYESCGIIIFTDPDHAGTNIRNKLTSLFPEAKQAYLTRPEAEKKGDIGIENAEPKSIINALKSAGRTERADAKNLPSMEDIVSLGFTGNPESKALREAVGAELGIGAGNAKAFLNKLIRIGISREELLKAWQNCTKEVQ